MSPEPDRSAPTPSSPILIVEDNEQNMYLMRYLLEGKGFSVVGASDGKTGLQLIEDIKPLAVLLDIQLPGMDGYDVAAALRKRPSTMHVPIIAVTSYAMPGDREKALAAGATGYVEKPIDPDTFVEQVCDYLKGGSDVTPDPHRE